ncbi:MAG: PKD domain-containing protein, partial [Gemmatimonadetes bacterium]|nr:PKD domain-containing protein [Gemmatimonadota bacterium]
SYGQITSWSWDFDDGTTSTEEHPLHRYEKAGEYVVVLTINGPQGTARRVKVNEVVVR